MHVPTDENLVHVEKGARKGNAYRGENENCEIGVTTIADFMNRFPIYIRMEDKSGRSPIVCKLTATAVKNIGHALINYAQVVESARKTEREIEKNKK